jgi:flagellin-like protein
MKKRGQSKIITTILLILMVIAIIVILWNILYLFDIKAEDEIRIQGFILDARIKYVNLNLDKSEATIGLYRPPGKGEIKGVKFIFEDKNLNNHLYEDRTTTINEIETEEFLIFANSLEPPIINFSEIRKISVLYIFERKSKEYPSPILDSYNMDGGSSGGGSSGGVSTGNTIKISDGSIKSAYKINKSEFGDKFNPNNLGFSAAGIGDLNGDGVEDIVVGDYDSDDGGTHNGAVWILFLNTSGGIIDEYKINESRFGNMNELNRNLFGNSVANIGDLNNDGVQDIAVGEPFSDDGWENAGVVWILFLNTSGGVINEYKINKSSFTNVPSWFMYFGDTIEGIGDLNGDGVEDIAVGNPVSYDGGVLNGAIWIMFLNTSGGVINEYKINESRFGNGNELEGDVFGASIANIGDLNNDGVQDIAVGEPFSDDGGNDNGAVWILFLNNSGGVIDEYKINESRFGNGNELDGGIFGSSIANIGDLNNDGVQDIVVGEGRNDDGCGGTNCDNGAFWILFLNTSGGVIDEHKINESEFGNKDELNGGWFGYRGISNIGDLNNDGVNEITVGEWWNDDGCGGTNCNQGAIWIMFFNSTEV